MTKPISRKMAVDCLLYWNYLISGNKPICCVSCKVPLNPGDDIQFDHRHAIVFDGPHEYLNLGPIHAECHKKKTALDIKANAKIRRLRGELKPKVKRKWPERKFGT